MYDRDPARLKQVLALAADTSPRPGPTVGIYDDRMDDARRREELAGFLRRSRARLTPADVGLPAGARRRVPGLRREEVAQLASIGTSWYAWLEQGRDVNVSRQVVESIAQALQLTAAEAAHLLELAGVQVHGRREPSSETVSPALRAVLERLEPNPAYVFGRRWDVLAWNRPAVALLGDFGRVPVPYRNILWATLTRMEGARLASPDQEGAQRQVVAQFRADFSRHVDDPAFIELVEALMRESPRFRELWARHDVDIRHEDHLELDHPVVGPLAFDYITLQVTDNPDLRLMVYNPSSGTDTAARLQRLLEQRSEE